MTKPDRLAILMSSEQHRHQLIVQRDQRFISINIDHVDGKLMLPFQRLQRLQHVVAKMAIGTGVDRKVRKYHEVIVAGVVSDILHQTRIIEHESVKRLHA